MEPVGYSYGNMTSENGDQLYSMNFTVDFTISAPNGTILAGQENLPLSNLVSHHQNKELMLQMSIDQTSPFPPGDYVLRYTFTDENSGKSFDIRNDVTSTSIDKKETSSLSFKIPYFNTVIILTINKQILYKVVDYLLSSSYRLTRLIMILIQLR